MPEPEPDPERRPEALPPLREVIARFGLRAHRSLGQHFLLDGNLTARIARAAGDLRAGTTVEIGPGPGGLTRSLLAVGAARLLAIDLDRRLAPVMQQLAEAWPDRLTFIEADALEIDLAAACAERGLPAPLRVVSNLPYNVSTALLVHWLGSVRDFESLTLMFQREVADRLTAEPRTKAYGRLSVLTQWLCRCERLFNVPAAAFTPPPKIVSTVVRLEPRPEPLASANRNALERVTAAAFGQRRKMLRQSLKSLGGNAEALLAEADVPPTARAEDLTVEQFCALARALDDHAPS